MRSRELLDEASALHNLAIPLIKLRRHDEAGQELQRAIECNKPYGDVAKPWIHGGCWSKWSVPPATAKTPMRRDANAIETYLTYRRAGGHSQSNQIELFSLVAEAVQQNTHDQAARQLIDLLERDNPPWYTALTRKLQSIIAGDRDPAFPANVEPDYVSEAELRLLIESVDQIPSNKQE